MGRTSAVPPPPRPARPPRARGVEAYSKRVGTGAATIGYPLYDAHGNNVATLTKGSGTWSIAGTLRAYDAWGNLAGGSALGDPSGRYCANLGHVQDDESGLVYMRARYYEPGTGRFISEDPARDGGNWYAYCENRPMNGADPTGLSFYDFQAELLGLFLKCKAMDQVRGIALFKACMENIVLDWMIYEGEWASEYEVMAASAYEKAQSAPSAIEKEISLQLAILDKDMASKHRGEAMLIGSLGRATARMYLLMLSIDLQ